MLYSLFNFIVNNLTFFTGAYSNNVFPDPLSKEEEEMYIEKMMKGDKEGNEITILDVLKTENPDYAEEIYKNDNIKLLRKYLNVLTKREREVLTKRYGLDNTDEITQKEIAKELGISRSYVSRIEKRAITKILREFIRNDSSTK